MIILKVVLVVLVSLVTITVQGSALLLKQAVEIIIYLFRKGEEEDEIEQVEKRESIIYHLDNDIECEDTIDDY